MWEVGTSQDSPSLLIPHFPLWPEYSHPAAICGLLEAIGRMASALVGSGGEDTDQEELTDTIRSL